MHTIAIAQCLLTEGRLEEVDRMISPLLPEVGNISPDSEEQLLLKYLLAQARLFRGKSTEEVLNLLGTVLNKTPPAEDPNLETALANMCMGLALTISDQTTQNLPHAIHLFQVAESHLTLLGRSDHIHWSLLGQSIALYELGQKSEADRLLKRTSDFVHAVNDQVAKHWLLCLTKCFESGQPISFPQLFSRDASAKSSPLPKQVYVSVAMRTLLDRCKTAAEGTAPILLVAERGSEKESIARFIHEMQPNNAGAFHAYDCASIADEWDFKSLQDLDTLANQQQLTLFLNHIESLPTDQQYALLDFLKRTDGSQHPGNNYIRVISASTTKLKQMVNAGRFDEALYHRLKICKLNIPPLRTRIQDIPVLALYFANIFRPAGTSRVAITERAITALMQYDWPGNIRQLRNEIERILVHTNLEPLPTIDLRSLSKPIRHKKKVPTNIHVEKITPEYHLDKIMTHTEKSVIERVLGKYEGQVSAAANALGLTRQGLYKKLKRLGINLSRFSRPDDHSSSRGSS